MVLCSSRNVLDLHLRKAISVQFQLPTNNMSRQYLVPGKVEPFIPPRAHGKLAKVVQQDRNPQKIPPADAIDRTVQMTAHRIPEVPAPEVPRNFVIELAQEHSGMRDDSPLMPFGLVLLPAVRTSEEIQVSRVGEVQVAPYHVLCDLRKPLIYVTNRAVKIDKGFIIQSMNTISY